MASGELSAERLVDYYLQRIESIDRSGPELRAVLELNPEARTVAKRLDREREQGRVRGPLHGIPVLLKDNIATADRMQTTAGSLALVGSTPRRDATVAARLRAAGAVILGKANMSEWANFRTTRSSSGWSGRGGQTRNPYDRSRSPCGSSSGSAVAPSANLVVAALGTETNGSIICPSSMNGVVGIKPTVGLVSRFGIIPVAHSQDTAGPIARTVEDAAIVLTAIAGPDARDPKTRKAPRVDYTESLDAGSLRGARLGIARSHLGADPRVDALVLAAADLMKQRGATIVDVTLPRYSQVADAALLVMLYEFRAGVEAYLTEVGGNGPRSVADVVAFNRARRHKEPLGQDLLIRAQNAGALSDQAYGEARRVVRGTFRGALDRVIAEHSLDAIIGPSGGPAWTIDLINGDHFVVGSSSPAALAGYPNITVPAGFIRGLPIGVSFFGKPWSEPRLIALAYAFEQARKARRPPPDRGNWQSK